MREVVLQASPKAQAIYEDACSKWLLAMEMVPPSLRQGLNLHQISKLVEWDMDAKVPEARRKLGLAPKGSKKTIPVAYRLSMHTGQLSYTYYATNQGANS